MSRSTFYSVLAQHYDELFSPSDEGLRLLTELATHSHHRVLDAACGTGSWVRRLVRRGVDVVGIDLSEPMIVTGRRMAAEHQIDPARLRVRNMQQVETHPDAPFGLIYCVGNSVAHLSSFDEVERFLLSAAHGLVEGGSFVLQYVTVDALTVGNAFELPSLETDEASLERTYLRSSATEIEFRATLRASGETPERISQRLLVIGDEQMQKALIHAGFHSIEVYGGFDRSPAEEGTWVRVICCSRG